MKRKTTVAIALALALISGTASASFAVANGSNNAAETDSLRDAIAPVNQLDCKRVKDCK